ncbi:MAG: hypothetical protein LLG14_05740 [Nocardiaceae bacterium]|nr:hypothetical protein [Nocardiaceae bacterium]
MTDAMTFAINSRYRLRSTSLMLPVVGTVVAETRDFRYVSRVSHQTAIVIDGFPRSGNSFARAAFRQANPGLGIASHLHSPLLIKQAVKRALPTILLIRDPRDATASLVQFLPQLKLRYALDEYRRYYERVARYLNHVLVADFPDVVREGGFAATLEACNDRFGSAFQGYVETSEAVSAVRQEIQQATVMYGGESMSGTFGLPCPERKTPAEIWSNASGTELALLDEAQQLYSYIRAINTAAIGR